MTTKIDRRDDVNPERGEKQYGDVEFADPVNNKYPIDTEEHVRAAWSYINREDNAAKYDAAEVRTIKDRIKRAAKKHGVEIESEWAPRALTPLPPLPLLGSGGKLPRVPRQTTASRVGRYQSASAGLSQPIASTSA